MKTFEILVELLDYQCNDKLEKLLDYKAPTFNENDVVPF